jgi:hypothetical protein
MKKQDEKGNALELNRKKILRLNRVIHQICFLLHSAGVRRHLRSDYRVMNCYDTMQALQGLVVVVAEPLPKYALT